MNVMKETVLSKSLFVIAIALLMAMLSCNDEDDDMDTTEDPTVVTSMSYDLWAYEDSGVSGEITFSQLSDESIKITLDLDGTTSGTHPAHIHYNTAAEGGGIAISLESVDGTTGMSETIVTATDDGMALTYAAISTFDGYVNVHLSGEDLSIVAQGDIGQNELTGEMKAFTLGEVDVEGISGTATFYERVNGEALAVIHLMNTPEGGSHPGHIHHNTAAEGGGIAFTFNPVDGTTGMSKTNVAKLDDGTAFGYDEVLDVDGYINIHASAENLASLAAQGDIGQNELTGEMKAFTLGKVDVEGISGMATFYERVNGEALAVIHLMNTPAGGSHPGHIHHNTAAEGGGIAFTFNPVNGTTGMSKTNVAKLDDGTTFGYDEVLDVDGYINIHASAENLASLAAQGDIGQNELTGNHKMYSLNAVDVTGVTGMTTFYERANGETLVVTHLMGITFAGDHPSHIHSGSVASAPGSILVMLSNVNASGVSKTNVTMDASGNMLNYTAMLALNGYLNVHNSGADLATLVAQGNVGANGN